MIIVKRERGGGVGGGKKEHGNSELRTQNVYSDINVEQ